MPFVQFEQPLTKWHSDCPTNIHYLRIMNILRCVSVGFALLISGVLNAQEPGEVNSFATGTGHNALTPRKGLNLHADYVYGVINNLYEVERQYKSGIGVGLVYRGGQWFSVSAVITKFQNHDVLSLDNCQAWSFDLDGQLSMRIAESDLYFRMIYGLGYTNWKGTYVGPNLNDNYHYYIGKLLTDKFYTANIGWGFSHYFCRQRLEGFGDFRLKFAADPRVMFSIRDTQFHFGLRYSLTNEAKERSKESSAKRKPNREKKRNVYKWMKNRS